MVRLLALLAVLGLARPVGACINDVELPRHEREFQSQYQRPTVVVEAVPATHDVGEWLTVGGVALMAGGFAVSSKRRARVRA